MTIGTKAELSDAETFDGAQNRNGGRQHAVAEEERKAEDGGDADASA